MGGELEGAEYELPEGDTPPFYKLLCVTPAHPSAGIALITRGRHLEMLHYSFLVSALPLKFGAHSRVFFSVVIKIIFAG